MVKAFEEKFGVSAAAVAVAGPAGAGAAAAEEKTVADEYKADRWDTLRIAAPKVHQTHVDKPLTYRWEVNGKVVSTEKDLAYECKEYTKDKNSPFLCRLTISNEDGSYYKNFKLHVQYR